MRSCAGPDPLESPITLANASQVFSPKAGAERIDPL
jgi:hypothetical protein